MGCRGRMNHERLRIADIGQMARELEAIDQETTGGRITLDTKGEHTTKGVGAEETLGQLMRRMGFQSGVQHPRYLGVALEMLCECEGIVAMALDAQAQCLETGNQLEGSEGV